MSAGWTAWRASWGLGGGLGIQDFRASGLLSLLSRGRLRTLLKRTRLSARWLSLKLWLPNRLPSPSSCGCPTGCPLHQAVAAQPAALSLKLWLLNRLPSPSSCGCSTGCPLPQAVAAQPAALSLKLWLLNRLPSPSSCGCSTGCPLPQAVLIQSSSHEISPSAFAAPPTLKLQFFPKRSSGLPIRVFPDVALTRSNSISFPKGACICHEHQRGGREARASR